MRSITEAAVVVEHMLEKRAKGFVFENVLNGTIGEFSVKIYNKGENVTIELLVDGKVQKTKSGGKDAMVTLYETLFDAVEAEMK
jgi:hypothetical protein